MKKDPSFLPFYKSLDLAIKKKDVSFIESIVSPKIMFTFGYEPGYKEDPVGTFLRYNKLEKNGEKSDFWKDFKSILDLGCVKKENNSFVCPYVSANWPDLDVYDYVVAIDKNVEIKSGTTQSSEVLKRVNYEILRILPPGMKDDWYIIKLDENNKGYVHKSKARSSVGLRAYFKKIKNKWFLTTFISGD